MKGAGMLVVSLRGCKFRILVSLRVSWEKRHYIIAVKVSLGLHAKKHKKIYILNSFYLLDSCNQSLKMISFRG